MLPLDDGEQHQILADRSHPAHPAGEATWGQQGSGEEMGTSIGSTMTLWGDEPSSCAAANDGYADFLWEQDEEMSVGPDVSYLYYVILCQVFVQDC